MAAAIVLISIVCMPWLIRWTPVTFTWLSANGSSREFCGSAALELIDHLSGERHVVARVRRGLLLLGCERQRADREQRRSCDGLQHRAPP
ncbi:MAG: hypothetical protein AUG85_12180 [Gemmatimonadetes bacterium 13_1_20CM_4_66_11]|nr:MAG: hypothetical protein AUG85_12180 [Gemmatimonadetes bacterium 13_1_20CM_4_66_11]